MSLPAILYDNRFDDGTQTASTTDSGAEYDVANIADWRPYTLWKPTAAIAIQYITVDCGSAKSADSFGISGHDLFSQNATISVEYSSDNFSGDVNEALAGFVPTSNNLIYKEFSTQSARYWRFKIASGYTAAPFIGVLVIGARMEFPIGVNDDGRFDPTGHSLQATSQRSQNGNLLGVALSHKNIKMNIGFRHISTSFVDGALKTFLDDHTLKPFFWVWDYSGAPTQVLLASLTPNFNKNFPYSSGTSLRHVNLPLVGILE